MPLHRGQLAASPVGELGLVMARSQVSQDTAFDRSAAVLDTSLPANVVRVPAGHATTSTLGAMFGAIRVESLKCRKGNTHD